jgi:hypothetical protein
MTTDFFCIDVVVHRLLQACIDPDVIYGQELIDKTKMKDLCDGKKENPPLGFELTPFFL